MKISLGILYKTLWIGHIFRESLPSDSDIVLKLVNLFLAALPCLLTEGSEV